MPGNGHDSCFLAELALKHSNGGKMYCIDVQEAALANTRLALEKKQLDVHRIEFIHGNHRSFPTDIAPETVSAIVYNLGYLPGGDKSKISVASDTLESLKNALPLLTVDGMLSITCYRGHPGGMEETNAVKIFCSSLPPFKWSVLRHDPMNRPVSPVLISVYRL